MKKIDNNLGFTIMEMVVAIGVFAMMMVTIMMIFKSILVGQEIAISNKSTQENLAFVMEVISKEFRGAKKQDHDCENIVVLAGFPAEVAINKVFNTANGGQVLYFKNRHDECVIYFLDALSGNRMKVARDNNLGDGLQNVYFITPDEVLVENLLFFARDEAIGAAATLQPYVTMRIDTTYNGTDRQEAQQSFDIQTTISSRVYEGLEGG